MSWEGAAHAGGLSFVDCTEQQQRIVAEAVLDAGELARIGNLYMNGDLDEDHREYERWFGAYDDPPPMMAQMMEAGGCGAPSKAKDRREKVRSNTRNIYLSFLGDDLIVDCSGTIELKPEEPERDCRSGKVVAFVDRNATFKTIYLCPPFWSRAERGYKSKAGSFVHEVSHFRDVAYTADLVSCDPFDCQSIAAGEPEKAIENSYNYQFFFESEPVGAPGGCLVGGGMGASESWVTSLFLFPLATLMIRSLRRKKEPRVR